MNRVPPSTRTRETIEKLLAEGTTKEDPRSTLVRLGVQVLLEEAHEAKVRDLLGRDYYERSGSERTGYRNGYRQGYLKTAEGEVRYAVPQVRDNDGSALAALRAGRRIRTLRNQIVSNLERAWEMTGRTEDELTGVMLQISQVVAKQFNENP